MERLDVRHVKQEEQEIRLFLAERNEALRLPNFLEHYRKLGVHRFFVTDNGSTDNTMEYLLSQEDVHVFYTEEHFARKEYWLKEMLDEFGKGHWCLAVDADELLIYPHYEQVPLSALCSYLASRQYGALESILVDMYPKEDIRGINYLPGESLLECLPYYDPFCYWSVPEERANFFTGDMVKQNTWFGGTRQHFFHIRVCCSKYSLFYYEDGVYLDGGMHGIEGCKTADIRGAVLHFKLLQDFSARAKEEAEREVHFKQAVQYKCYQEKLEKLEECIFYHHGSLKYSGSISMTEQGIMQTSGGYEKYAKEVMRHHRIS